MRMRRIFILFTLLILLLPILSINGTIKNEKEIIIPTDFNSDIGVLAGDTFYYNIDELILPPDIEIDNVTLPDFSGNQIFVKVLFIDETYQYDLTTFGTTIHLSLGFKFAKDTTFELDFSLLSTDIVIPEGAATPSITSIGNPHFESTPDLAPTMFFLNNDWDSHATLLEGLGFTVTNDANELSAIMFDGAGVITFTWRKSDGALTHLMVEDILFLGADFSDMTLDISLAEKYYRPLGISVGDQIEIEVDHLDAAMSVSGEIATYYDQTEINENLASYESLAGNTILRLSVEEIYGVYYVCSAWVISDFETYELQKLDFDLYFNGFQGTIIGNFELIPNFDYVDDDYIGSAIVPAITPDWDIYEGYMLLGNTLLGVYINEILDVFEPSNEQYSTINDLDFTFGFDKKREYYYYQQALEYDIEQNITYYYDPLAVLEPQHVYKMGIRTELSQKLYIAYHETGVFAGLRVKYSLKTTYYDYVGMVDFDTGSLEFEVDVKLRNVDFNPPDAFGGGFIPGFRWLLVIPALLPIATYRIIARKRK